MCDEAWYTGFPSKHDNITPLHPIMNYIKSRLIAKFLEEFQFKYPISEVQHPFCYAVIF